jgi:sugar phosphate isomerase/epimerase
MAQQTNRVGLYSRRDFGKLAFSALPAAGLLGSRSLFAQAKPNSVWGGVPFGIFAPYRFGPEASDLEGALKALVKFGVSQTELSSAIVERYVGAPQPAARAGGAGAAAQAAGGGGRAAAGAAAPATAPAPGAIPCENGVPVARGAGGGGAGSGGAAPAARGRAAQTPEQQTAARAQAEALRSWRTAVPMTKFADVRQKFADAGVTIYAYRLTLTTDMPDAEYDYTFNAAKALGAAQITMEQPSDRALSKRIGEFAAKHQVNVGYHLHTTATINAWDEVMAQSPRNGLQLDIGHYVAGTGLSPVPLIEKLHSRIYSMHLKDRKRVCHDASENMPWGQGDTPIREVLQTLKKNKWAIPVGIEFEYNVPAGSTWDAEIAKCVAYGKEALLA